MESDFRYYTRRADEERRRALHALTPEARERHKELASLFAAKAAKPVKHAALAEPQLVGG